MPPVAPVELTAVILTALCNPAVLIVAVWMGRNADQWRKLPVAAFAAALVGCMLAYRGVFLGVPRGVGCGRATAVVFVAAFVFGLGWAGLAYCLWPRRP